MSKRAGNERLRQAIDEKFATRAEAARAFGTWENNVRRWIKGQRPIKDHREKIARVLGMKPEELWP